MQTPKYNNRYARAYRKRLLKPNCWKTHWITAPLIACLPELKSPYILSTYFSKIG
ncbi:hypothetical protein [Dulcicalothrix desertica]|uniref:hypothetical protein n=1 Tax=Dulcicalothrix desertica TaxID=32056 RepID=UPI001F288103|nr:hypothetical protein [Dulcicalothrix desertica]